MDAAADTSFALLALQTAHTIVYAAGQASVLIVLWCGITGRPNAGLRYAVACLVTILIARALNGGVCPLYTMALWLAQAGPGDPVRDMLTPIWFNELVTPINFPLGAFGMLLVAWRELAGRWAAPLPALQEINPPRR